MKILSSPLPTCPGWRAKEPSINDVAHERRDGVVLNMTIVLINCVNGTGIRGGGQKI